LIQNVKFLLRDGGERKVNKKLIDSYKCFFKKSITFIY
ncbi:unnamed protein product, partial [marine sediment metagenome]